MTLNYVVPIARGSCRMGVAKNHDEYISTVVSSFYRYIVNDRRFNGNPSFGVLLSVVRRYAGTPDLNEEMHSYLLEHKNDVLKALKYMEFINDKIDRKVLPF